MHATATERSLRQPEEASRTFVTNETNEKEKKREFNQKRNEKDTGTPPRPKAG